MNKAEFQVCPICGNIIKKVKDVGVPIMCCGRKMEEVTPNTVDASQEKHIPIVKINGDLVEVFVGEIEHPMEEKHYIEWIYLKTENGGYLKKLNANTSPATKFMLAEEKVIEVYAYCNLHGLWMTKI